MTQSRIGVYHDEPTRSTPLVAKLMIWCVSYRLGVFATIWLPSKLGAQHSELVQKFVPRSRVGIFRNESTRSTPWDRKLMFWCISYHLDPFGTVRLPYETQGKTGRTSAKVRATKSSRIFFTTNAPDPPHWTRNATKRQFRVQWGESGAFVAKNSEATSWHELLH